MINLDKSKVLILTFDNEIDKDVIKFIENKDYVIINNNNTENRYINYPLNEHHFTTKFHRDVILSTLSNLLNFEFNIDDFYLKENIAIVNNKKIDLSYLVPKDDNYKFDITGLDYNIHYESDFSGLLYSEKYKHLLCQTGLLTQYHQLYAFPHSCSIVKNLYKNNGRTLLISGDSQAIPFIPILCTIFKEVWYFDNRTNTSYKNLLEQQTFTDILIQVYKNKLDKYTEKNLNLKPMISIVMPTIKPLQRLNVTLLSILSQSYKDWELIVVDASKDKYFEKWLTEKIDTDFLFKNINAKQHLNKIKIIKPTENTNCPGNMYMEGFKNTSCGENDFVIFLDDDDFLANYLFENIYDISYKYPEADMISGDFISPLFDGNKVLKNVGTFNSAKVIAKHNEIWIHNWYAKLTEGFWQQRNFHDWKANLHPKIIRKKAIKDNRYKICENTPCLSDSAWVVQSVLLKEVYILDVVFYWVRDYANKSVTNQTLQTKERTPSEFALKTRDILENKFGTWLDEIKFKKDRIYYTPKNHNYIV